MVDKNELKEQFKAVSNAVSDYYVLMGKIRKTCLDILIELLSEEEGNKVEISEENMMSVPYDGGNHPEYASNCFSMLNAVYLKDDVIYLDIEDCDAYEIDRVDNEVVFQIAEAVVNQLV